MTWRIRRAARPAGDAASRRRSRVLVLGIAAVATAGVVGGLAATGALASGSQAGSGARQPPAGHADPGVSNGPAAPGGGLTPAQIRAAYSLPALSSLNAPGALKGITGKGETIVIVDSFGSPAIRTDLTRFDRYFRVPGPPSFQVIQPVGAVPPYHPGNSNRAGWAAETTLDVEWAHVVAPGARIVLVETPTSENEGTTGFPQIVAAEKYVLAHKLGQVISQSFAATEQTFSARSAYAAIKDLRAAYRLAVADHVTVLAATGDEGATSDEFNMTDLYPTRAVAWPSTDPLVTAVGGTQLDLRANGTRVMPDVAWSDGGGGRSLVFSRPSYQNGVASQTGSHRGIPDISMDASCRSGVAIYGSFYSGGRGQWSSICGTSLATPLFAGVVALADQYAGHGLGLINPALYQMQARHDRGIVDVTSGNNTQRFTQNGKRYTVTGFSAGPGYDLASGVGTVNAAYFVPELARTAS